MTRQTPKYGEAKLVLPYEEESAEARRLRKATEATVEFLAFPGLLLAFIGGLHIGGIDLGAVFRDFPLFLLLIVVFWTGYFLKLWCENRRGEMPRALVPKSIRFRWAREQVEQSLEIMEEDPETALELAEDAARWCPYPMILGCLAHVLETIGREDDAFLTWRCAAWPPSGYQGSEHNRGVCLIDVSRMAGKRGEFSLAEAEATNALHRLDRDDTTRRVEAHIYRGLARFDQGDDSGAREDWEWALSHAQSAQLQEDLRPLLFHAGTVQSVRERGTMETFALLGQIFRQHRQN